MIDFKDIEVREAFRDFVLAQLQRKNKTTNWLVLTSGLSKDTVCDRILASNQEGKSAPNERTRTRIFDALECSFSEFESFLEDWERIPVVEDLQVAEPDFAPDLSLPDVPASPSGRFRFDDYLTPRYISGGVIGLLVIMGMIILSLVNQKPANIEVVITENGKALEVVLTYDNYTQVLEIHRERLKQKYDEAGDVQRMVIARDLRVVDRKLKDPKKAFEITREKAETLEENRGKFEDEQYNYAVRSLIQGHDGTANKLLADIGGIDITSDNTDEQLASQGDDTDPVQVDQSSEESSEEQVADGMLTEQVQVSEAPSDIIVVESVAQANSESETVAMSNTEVEQVQPQIIEENREEEINVPESTSDSDIADDTDTQVADTDAQTADTGSDDLIVVLNSGDSEDVVPPEPEPAKARKKGLVNAEFLKQAWAFNGDVVASLDEIKTRLAANVKKYVEHNKIFKKPEFTEEWPVILGSEVTEEQLYDRVAKFLLEDITHDTRRKGKIWNTKVKLKLKYENFINDYIDFAIASQNIGYYSQARHYYRIVLKLAPDHILNEKKVVQNNYAVLLAYNDELSESFSILDALHKERIREFGEDSEIVADTLTNLGNILMLKGDYKGAFAIFEQVHRLDEKNYGINHPNIIRDLSNLGAATNGLGDYSKAKEFLDEAQLQSTRHKELNPLHKAALFMNLGIVNRELGKSMLSRSELDSAKKSMKLAFGNDHVFTLYLRAFAEKLNFQ